MIESQSIRKEYGGAPVLNNCSFSVPEGDVACVLGADGSGKSVLVEILAGLTPATRGEGIVSSRDIEDEELKQHVGYLPDEPSPYPSMTPHSYLQFIADLHGVPRGLARDRSESAFNRLGISEIDQETKLNKLSSATVQKVEIARTVVHNPTVLLFDTPFSNLGAVASDDVRRFLEHENEEGTTILFTASAVSSPVETVCDHAIVLNNGDVVANGRLEDIRREFGNREYDVRVDVPVPKGEEITDGEYKVVTQSIEEVGKIREAASALGGSVTSLRSSDDSLDDLVRKLVSGPSNTPPSNTNDSE